MTRGDSLIFDVNVVKASAGGGTSPQDITGWFLWCTLKRTYSDPDQLAVAQVTTAPSSVPAGGSLVIVLAVAGQARVSIPPIATRGFPDGPTTIVYDVQGRDPAGNIYTIEPGDIVVSPDVTNSIGG